MTIVNIYAPNVHQKRFVLDVLKKSVKLRQGDLIVCGDLMMWRICTYTPPTERRDIGSVQAAMECSDLYDARSCGHGDEGDYSYISHSQMSYSRINIFLVDKSVATGPPGPYKIDNVVRPRSRFDSSDT